MLTAAIEELSGGGPAGLSLRAVARRAGVSHAAPKHHFGDRAGLLTALASEGFRRLGERFRNTPGLDAMPAAEQFVALGKTYLDFSVAESDLFEVMYGTEPLHADDPELMAERQAMFKVLQTVSGELRNPEASPDGPTLPVASLTAWALVHGLVMLVRDGSLQRVTNAESAERTVELARELMDEYARVRPPAVAQQRP